MNWISTSNLRSVQCCSKQFAFLCVISNHIIPTGYALYNGHALSNANCWYGTVQLWAWVCWFSYLRIFIREYMRVARCTSCKHSHCFFFVFVPEHWIWQRIALFEVLICWRFLIYVLLSPSTFKAYADTDNHRVVEKNWSILPRNAFVNIKTIKEWKSRRTGHKQIQKFNNVECLV